MTGRQRLLAALGRQQPDVVPVTWELVDRFAHAVTGRSGWRAMVEVHRQIGSAVFNLQGIGPHLRGEPREGYQDRSVCTKQADGSSMHLRTLRTPGGTLTDRRVTGFIPGDPLVLKTIEYLVKDRSDYDIVERFWDGWAQVARPDVTESVVAQAFIGDDGLAGYWMCDSLYHVASLRRDTEYILDLIEIPRRMQQLFDVIDRLKEKEIDAFNASAAEVLILDVCWASTSILSPKMVDQFVMPRLHRLAQRVAKDKIWGFFTTGKIRPVLPWLVDCEPDFIQHFDVLGDCDLAEVSRTFGDRICIVGNYNPVVLAKGSVADAQREAQRCLDAAMAGGGYIMSTSDEVPADAKLENMKAVVEYVNQHGRY